MRAVVVEIIRWYKITDLPKVYSSRVQYAAKLKDGSMVELWVSDYRKLELMSITEDGYEPLSPDDIEMFCKIPENFLV